MTNRLYLRDRNNYPWGNIDIKIVWDNGNTYKARSNKNGTALFTGEGVISHIMVEGEIIGIEVEVEGGCTVVAVSQHDYR